MFDDVSTADAEVVVVGAGIAGLATAYEVSRNGRDVVVLEQFDVAHDRGSSHGASRVFRLSYPTESWVRLAQEALVGWQAYESELGQSLLRRTGSIDVGDHTQGNAAALAGCGAATETLTPKEAARRYGFRLAPAETGLFQPDAGVLAAGRTLELLATASTGAGARIETMRRVEHLEDAGDRILLQTSAGSLSAKTVVVTAGAWGRSLVAPLGIDLAVTVTMETVAYVDVPRADDLPVLVVTGRADGHADNISTYALADGPTRLKVGAHHTGPEVEPDAPSRIDESVVGQAMHWIAERLPSLPATPAGGQTCLYTNTIDEGFVLERHGRVIVGSACSGHGFKFAPVIGAKLARLTAEALADT